MSAGGYLRKPTCRRNLGLRGREDGKTPLIMYTRRLAIKAVRFQILTEFLDADLLGISATVPGSPDTPDGW